MLLGVIIALTMLADTPLLFSSTSAGVDRSKFVFEVWIFVMMTSSGSLAATISMTDLLVTTFGSLVLVDAAAGGACGSGAGPLAGTSFTAALEAGVASTIAWITA